ncbi:MAG: DUF5011 domain-containing protein [Cocleimonas sp.]|nr:DUF5011 domain-containing protein [Cocleimonas sp.]
MFYFRYFFIPFFATLFFFQVSIASPNTTIQPIKFREATPINRWDIDANGEAKALSDGLLVLRYLFGFHGQTLIDKAVSLSAARKTAPEIESYLKKNRNDFDIDGDGEVKPLSDGLLLLRYLFDFRGNTLISGVVSVKATRKTAAEIEAYLNQLTKISPLLSFSFDHVKLPKLNVLPTEPVYFDFTLRKSGTAFDQVQLYTYLSTENKIAKVSGFTGYGIKQSRFIDNIYSTNNYIRLKAPKTKGVYYAGICVVNIFNDNRLVKKINECSKPLQIEVTQSITTNKKTPDLIIKQTTLSPNNVKPKNTFSFDYDVINQNELINDGGRVSVHLSTDSNISPSDALLSVGSKTLTSLKKGESKHYAYKNLIAPDKEGVYWVGLCLEIHYENIVYPPANCSQGVKLTVKPRVDIIPPEIKILGANPVNVIQGSVYRDAGAIATDDVDGNIKVTTTGDTVETSKIDSYVLFYSATDKAGNKTTVSRTIIVQKVQKAVKGIDIIPSTIALAPNKQHELNARLTYVDGSSEILSGTYLTWQVADSGIAEIKGAVSTATVFAKKIVILRALKQGKTTLTAQFKGVTSTPIKVVVSAVDITVPVIKLIGDASVTLKQGDTYKEAGATATDDTDGTIKVNITGAVDTATRGTYRRTYTATDKANNRAVVYRSIFITGKIDPRRLQKRSVIVISTDYPQTHIKTLKRDFNAVIRTKNEQTARYETRLDFNKVMLVDLGRSSEKGTQRHQYNPQQIHHFKWYKDTGSFEFIFKDKENKILHRFKFNKQGGFRSAYFEFDGEQYNASKATYQTDPHGYLYLEKGVLRFDSEYLLDASGTKISGFESKTWTLSKFDNIKSVDIVLQTTSFGVKGYSQIPLVIFYERSVENTVRTIDGSANNLQNKIMGKADTPLRRIAPNGYTDYISSPAGLNRPNPRTLSNIISMQAGSIPNQLKASDFLWVWGQFLDHDIDLTESASPKEYYNIPIPLGDSQFDPLTRGISIIPFLRSDYDKTTGFSADNPRQQMNGISTWHDASNVYGSDDKRATALRTMDGSGKLKSSAGNLLPFNIGGYSNAGGTGANLFFAGDIRANEQVSLTSLHTLFMREHNRLADYIAAKQPNLSGEEIYQKARKLVGAEMQIITYNEYLPLLLGASAIKPYSGYQPAVNATISNLFSGAAYRYGHSALNPVLLRLDAQGKRLDKGNLSLKDAFFSPKRLTDEGGIAPILRGLNKQVAQSIDSMLIDAVRNFLFGKPGEGGFDLASLNIQRGRDHGLPSYNDAREALGLPRKHSFTDITLDSRMSSRLARAYQQVDDIDVWIGGLSEEHVPGAMVGELIRTVLTQQFEALRDGDRFWYQYDLSDDELALVDGVSLADIIRRNTVIDKEISNTVFKAK